MEVTTRMEAHITKALSNKYDNILGIKLSGLTRQQANACPLPVPKFMKGLSPSLHVVQIASYEEMNTIIRKIT